MTILNMQQGSDEWLNARAGKLTASEMQKCITPLGKVSESETATGYIESVVWEMLSGQPSPAVRPTEAMRWGTENEAAAREVYSRLTGNEIDEAGLFVNDDEPLLAFSPDGLVGDDGGIQIKCPWTPGPHFEVARSIIGRKPAVPKKNIVQVQCELAFSGRQWWDFVSYDPRLPELELAMLVVRVERDSFTDKIMDAALQIRDRVMEGYLELGKLRRKRND